LAAPPTQQIPPRAGKKNYFILEGSLIVSPATLKAPLPR